MPALLWRAVAWAFGSIIGRLLVGLGVGLVTYEGMDVLVSQVQSYLATLTGQMTGVYLQAFNAFGFPQAFAMIFAAVSARASLSVGTRLAFKKS